MPKCTILTCSKNSVAKGLCTNHYYRLRKYGDAEHVEQVQFHGLTVPERFLKYVKKTEYCWLWVGSKNNKGYAQLNVSGVPKLASRISWEIANGPIPKGKYILHKCDNPLCVNPDHVYPGDQTQNMADMWGRGRAKPGLVQGQKHGMSKLTELDILAIRSSDETVKEICEHFGVSHTTVSDIKNRKTWKHVKGD